MTLGDGIGWTKDGFSLGRDLLHLFMIQRVQICGRLLIVVIAAEVMGGGRNMPMS